MRVIAGEYRGRHIDSPPENITRPTVDRVREALFSSLISMRGGLEGAYVLDAFAGSGAMALEALSRGADFAYLMEHNRKAYTVAERNIRSLGIGEDRVRLQMADAFSAVPTAPNGEKFDVIFLDPPYAEEPEKVLALLERLFCAGSIAERALCLYEHDKASSHEADDAYRASGYGLIKRRNYGRAVVDTLQRDICATM